MYIKKYIEKYSIFASRVRHNMLSPFKLCKWMYLDVRSMYPLKDDYERWVWVCKKDLTEVKCSSD